MPSENFRAASPPEAALPGRKQRRFRRLADFWEQVTEGARLATLWEQFKTEARSSYGLYSREVDWEAIGRVPRWKRTFRAAWALFAAMLMKLSPTRRVLLLVAVASLLIVPMRYETSQRGVTVVTVGILSPGVLLLFVLLALELADRVTMKRDLEIAREIQQMLVPAAPPQLRWAKLAFATRPANTVAGDYYDAFVRSPDGAPESSLSWVPNACCS